MEQLDHYHVVIIVSGSQNSESIPACLLLAKCSAWWRKMQLLTQRAGAKNSHLPFILFIYFFATANWVANPHISVDYNTASFAVLTLLSIHLIHKCYRLGCWSSYLKDVFAHLRVNIFCTNFKLGQKL